ncbi:MAG: apolipoprotein N-acyltransferase [Bacteroidota bacterium]|nr:apolipoprotein N-acyltransferase [Bacteroidota bacterium]
MKGSLRQYYYAAAISGALLGVAFPPLPLGGLAFGALVPLFWVLEAPLPLWALLRVGYIFGFCFHGVANWWVSSWQPEADPYLLLAGLLLWLAHPIFFLVPLVATWWIARRVSPMWGIGAFPLFWLSFEWLHSIGEIGYPWLLLGYTQALNLYWIQVVDLSGIWGASFLVLWANVVVYRLLAAWAQARGQGVPMRRWLQNRRTLGYLALCSAIVGLPIAYGGVRLQQLRAIPAQGALHAVLVQPNFNPWAKWERHAAEQIRWQQSLTDSVLRRFRADIVVWNETAVPVPITLPEYRWLWESLLSWVQSQRTALLSGFAEMRLYDVVSAPPLAKPLPWDSARFYEAYNAAFLLTSSGEVAGIHRKQRLTPFAERFPYAEVFGRLPQLVEWGVGISAWAQGKVQSPLLLQRRSDTVAFGVAICIESIFPDFARAYARQGCNVLVVLSNDAWFDHTPGPAQHFAIARVRAVELRRPLLRCANSGITAAVLPTGEVLAQLPQYKAAVLSVALPLVRAHSLYEYIGELLPQGVALIAGLVLLAAGFWKPPQQQKL